MPKPRKSKAKSFPLKIGSDPSLWRYRSVEDAISQNVPLLAQLIISSEQIETEEQAANTDDGMKEA